MTNKGTTQVAGENNWYHDQSINISIPTDMNKKQLLDALQKNRNNLESIKRDYWIAKKNNNQADIAVNMHEIMRVVNAIETLKNRLALTGERVPKAHRDLEHPDKACQRFRAQESCFVVTAVFGIVSSESWQVKRRCRWIFLLNPLLTLGWCLYRYYGPILAQWARSSEKGFHYCKKFIANPIVRATGRAPWSAFAAMSYLVFLSIIALILLIPSLIVHMFFSIGKRFRSSNNPFLWAR